MDLTPFDPLDAAGENLPPRKRNLGFLWGVLTTLAAGSLLYWLYHQKNNKKDNKE